MLRIVHVVNLRGFCIQVQSLLPFYAWLIVGLASIPDVLAQGCMCFYFLWGLLVDEDESHAFEDRVR